MDEENPEEEVIAFLKSFPSAILTGSLKGRQQYFHRLWKLIVHRKCSPNHEVPVIKLVIKALLSTIHRYHDRKSRYLVVVTIRQLLASYESSANLLLFTLLSASESWKVQLHSRATDHRTEVVWTWLNQLDRNQLKNLPDDSRKQLLQIHINCCTSGISFSQLNLFWTERMPLETYVLLLKSLNEDSLGALILWAQVVKHAVKNNKENVVSEYQTTFLEMLVKHVVGSKALVDDTVIERVSVLFQQVKHEEFKSTLLPAINKAVLRNPEISLKMVPHVLKYLSLDLSPYALDIGKMIGLQLHSKDQQLRLWSIQSVKSLARQCSDSSAIESLFKHLFGIYNGSEGKITIVDQRLSVLDGITALNDHCVSGRDNLHKLSILVCESLMSATKNEIHEGTLIHLAATMSLFASRLTEIPESLVTWYKSVSSAKVTTAGIRSAYISCFVSAINENSISSPTISELLNILSPIVIRSIVAPIAQMPVLSEGVRAAQFVFRVLHYDPGFQDKAKSAIAVLNEPSKITVLSRKFIFGAEESTLISLIEVILYMFLDHELIVKEKDAFVKCLILLCSHRNYNVWKRAVSAASSITSSSQSFSSDLMTSISKVLVNHPNLEDEDVGYFTFSPGLCRVLHQVAMKNPTSKESIVIDLFAAAHINVIYQQNSKIWISTIQTLFKVDEIDRVISSLQPKLLSILFSLKDKEHRQNCIESLVRYFANFFITPLIEQVIQGIENADLKTVTRTEYEIFLTPPGMLYDSSVVDMFKEGESKNIKRESKLYSYKEQMEELALRQELEAKKKDKEPQLNKKQQEAKAAQLEKEAVIRDRLQELANSFEDSLDNLAAILKGNPFEAACTVSSVVTPLINHFSSFLCYKRAIDMFSKLIFTSFTWEHNASISQKVCHASLQQLKSLNQDSGKWTNEDMVAILKFLEEQTCPKIDGIYNAEENIDLFLTAPAFSVTFPLISNIALNSKDEAVISQCLHIIKAHCLLRESSCTNSKNQRAFEREILKNPKFLPREDMFRDILHLLKKVPTHLEPEVASTLYEVAKCCNGDVGCTRVSNHEVTLLLNGLKDDNECVRLTCLDCLSILKECLLENPTQPVIHRLFVAQFESSDTTSPIARKLWADCNFQPSKLLCQLLLADILEADAILRQSIAFATQSLLQSFPEEREITFNRLISTYRNHNKLSPVVLDAFGRPTQESQVDPFKPRLGVAIVLTEIVALASEATVPKLISFFIPEALSDRNINVQNQILEAAIRFIDAHGQENIDSLLQKMEKFLDEAPDNKENDAVRRNVIILMGNLAKHMSKDDPRVKPIVVKLIESLSTPSQIVQEAVANCLPHLIPSFKEEAPTVLDKLMDVLFTSESYGERRGAAYGVAAVVKGLGILSLKQLQIMDRLTAAIENKKVPNQREGALFAFEMLCILLGRLFEPYVIHILPNLLLCYGDNNPKVRKAASDTAKAIMKRLSAHGVKLILPSLLNGLDEDLWRTKVGAIDLLGSMSHCAPKQLSACLPNIVPKLMDVLTDSHPKVQTAGVDALKQIGRVIRNPEVQAIVPVLLQALEDPANKTNHCLQKMLNTRFVHFIDAPSLALIMPVIERSFKSRSTETRKMGAQIIGNMYSLTDQKDLAPYLPNIIPGLKQSLIDPVPEVRGVAARALGAMVRGVGDEIVEELMPWLLQTLTSEANSVDRSGAAQGLAEVIGGLGLGKLQKFIPEIIETAERNDVAPHVRDGYIMMFIYLPMVFNLDFIPFIGRIITPILKALADENEFVRETALKAGQRIVSMYADTAIQLLLPQLEKGLFDDNWRIRLSSVQLLGDLLYKISGVSGKMTTETVHEDDNFGTESSSQAILSALGLERRNRVFSGLYMGRSDVSLQVRQAALHVWKVVVTNTPRTLREIMPTLFGLLLGCLASNSDDKQQIAARTLGDLVRKLGERVLPEMIPILEQGLNSDRADQRQGVCIGLSEIISSTSRDMVQAFSDSLVPTITKALYDPLPEVRIAAAKTFESLHSACGSKILDEILPPLLDLLGHPVHGENTLDGLRQIMAIKGRVVLPYLIPQLTAEPVNTRALSLLSTVAGDALSKHLSKVLPALLSSLSKSLDTPDEKQEIEYCQAVILSVTEDVGIRTIIDYLLDASKNHDARIRRASVMMIYAYSCQSRPISPYVSQLLRGLIFLLTDKEEAVLTQVWEAIHSITKSLDAKTQINLVPDVRSALRYAASDMRPPRSRQAVLLPGLCLSKGIAPILPVFREAILNGNPEQKELASQGLSELIELTSPEALQSSVVNIAGPLIRILGDRYAWNVKVSVLDTLSLLLEKVGPQLRPFIPQLQQTFLKALADTHKQVRVRAAFSLSHLVRVHSKCDPVFTEIHNLVKSDDLSIRETALFALRLTILPAGDKTSEQVLKIIAATITGLLSSSEDLCRTHAAACLGCLCKSLNEEDLSSVVKHFLLKKESSGEWTLMHGCSVALRIALKETPERLIREEWHEGIVKTLGKLMSSDRMPLIISGIKGTAYYFKFIIQSEKELNTSLLTTFSRGMNHSSNEVKQATSASSVYLAKALKGPLPIPLLKSLVPLLVNGTKEKNTMVKANAEQALVCVLRLRLEGDDTISHLTSALDPGPRDSLQDCIHKVLKRTLSQAEPKEEEFDDTLTP